MLSESLPVQTCWVCWSCESADVTHMRSVVARIFFIVVGLLLKKSLPCQNSMIEFRHEQATFVARSYHRGARMRGIRTAVVHSRTEVDVCACDHRCAGS